MSILKKQLEYTDIASSDTEIKYAVVNAILSKAELLILLMPTDESAKKRIFMQTKNVLKRLKREGKVNFFVMPENILKEDTVCKYTFDMFPRLSQELNEIKSNYDYFIVRLTN